ncbi:MAG TPA: hypothetical protein VGO57_02900 [Verrucomicrobiae bacterium]
MEIYEILWSEAAVAFTRGKLLLDPHLPDKTHDARRGVTIVLRPPLAIRERIQGFLTKLAVICPGQYFYPPETFHITVLSIISGTERWREQMPQLAACRKIIKEVLVQQPGFKINFRGITASPGCVMIQGFPTDNHLEQFRNQLRKALSQNGFGAQLDRRYKIVSAHITAMRFCNKQIDSQKLLAFLTEHRAHDFGQMTAHELELIFSDWYAAADATSKLETYSLT